MRCIAFLALRRVAQRQCCSYKQDDTCELNSVLIMETEVLLLALIYRRRRRQKQRRTMWVCPIFTQRLQPEFHNLIQEMRLFDFRYL